jgi:hypothetical protein
MEQADSVPRAVVGTKVPAASGGFTGTHSRGGRHGQAYPRIVAAYLHGRVCRRRHVRRNPAPLKAAVAIGARADAPGPYVAVDTHCLFLLSRGRVLGRLGWQASQTTRAFFFRLGAKRRLRGWGGRTRTQKCHGKIPLKGRTDFR